MVFVSDLMTTVGDYIRINCNEWLDLSLTLGATNWRELNNIFETFEKSV